MASKLGWSVCHTQRRLNELRGHYSVAQKLLHRADPRKKAIPAKAQTSLLGFMQVNTRQKVTIPNRGTLSGLIPILLDAPMQALPSEVVKPAAPACRVD